VHWMETLSYKRSYHGVARCIRGCQRVSQCAPGSGIYDDICVEPRFHLVQTVLR
jgi:hypothetical protein